MSTQTKILIGDDSLECGVSWASAFKARGFFAITRAKKGRAIIDCIINEKPSAIIIDSKTAEIEAKTIIRSVRNFPDYIPVIVVITSCDKTTAEHDFISIGADFIMAKPLDTNSLVKAVNELLRDRFFDKGIEEGEEEMYNDIECIVTEIIHQIGVPAHVKGYHYLRTAIIKCVSDPEMMGSVTKSLYPSVADEHNTTPSRVERAIRHAIEIAWDRGDVDVLDSYFGYTIHTARGKPTNSEFIALISDKIRLQYKSIHNKSSKDDILDKGLFGIKNNV